ncbi:MAG: hypothetical protein IJ842_00695 [Bacilli bacterium]|nr:hypothetical protein [Bacilli bacterium]
MKKIPKIYQNSINKKINNNRNICYIKEQEENNLDTIFNDKENFYNIRVIITTKNKTYDTYIIGRNKESILLMDNTIININEITSIKRKN